MNALYFAYASNLKRERFFRRLPAARSVGIARLPHWTLRMNKRGRDGSAKANLSPLRGAEVWGALYTVPVSRWSRLDGFEGGYLRRRVSVWTPQGERREAVTYVSVRLQDALPFDWYRALMIEGAREHDLPAAWLARLEALPFRSSPPGAPRG